MPTDDRTNRRAPKAEALKIWPKAHCKKVHDIGFVVLSGEEDQPRFIGNGRTAWSAWMMAEIHPRTQTS